MITPLFDSAYFRAGGRKINLHDNNDRSHTSSDMSVAAQFMVVKHRLYSWMREGYRLLKSSSKMYSS